MAWNYNVEFNQLLFNKRQPCKQRGRQPKEREASDFCWICRIHVNFKIECRNVWQVSMVCWVWRLSTTIEKKFFFRMDDSSCTVSLNQWNLKRELVLQKRWLNTWLKSCPLINSPSSQRQLPTDNSSTKSGLQWCCNKERLSQSMAFESGHSYLFKRTKFS